jgi:hypothetical protein
MTMLFGARMTGFMAAPSQLWDPARDLSAAITVLDARRGITLSTGVSSWASRKGSGTVSQATAGSQPAYNTSGINSLPSVDFDGTDDVMTALFGGWPSGSSEMWFVGLIDFIDTNNRGLFELGQVQFRGIRTTGTTPGRLRADGPTSGSSNLADTSTNVLGVHVIAVGFKASSVVLRIDGTQVASGGSATSLTDGAAFLNLGDYQGSTIDPAKARMGLVNVTSALTTDELEKLEAFCAWEYGQSSLLASGHTYKNTRPTA